MTRQLRSRHVAQIAAAALLVLGIAACTAVSSAPNTTLTPHSEFGRSIDGLWRLLLVLGTIVFIGVELALLVTVVKWRKRAGSVAPKQTHGNTTLEITWTLIPAVVLAFIAVPTIRTIFKTQAKAVPSSLQVEVIGHQWWWEFKYPQYNIVTANELYLPVGKTANFSLKSADVIHSFWIPELAGKRDLMANHTNYLWFTPESTYAWNGFCAEFCGASHGNMHFRVFTLAQGEWDAWARNQQAGPAYMPPSNPTPSPGAPTGGSTAPVSTAIASMGPNTPAGSSAGPVVAMQNAQPQTGTWSLANLPKHVLPDTPLPDDLTFDDALVGDKARGAQTYRTSACIACHMVQSMSMGVVGPNLTHVGSRTTIAGSLYPNDPRHLARWIKNAPKMKAGSLMPTLGLGQIDHMTGRPVPGGLTDQQIADIVAYLQSLK